MKLIVTENQFSKIRLIKESEEYLNKYKKLCSDRAKQVDDIYNKVMSRTLDEILSDETFIDDAYNILNKIENDVYAAEKQMIGLWEKNLIGVGDDNFDIFIDDIADTVTTKLNPLHLLVMDLQSLREKVSDRNLYDHFKHIKPIDIQSF